MKKAVVILLTILVLFAVTMSLPVVADDTVGTVYYVDATGGSNYNSGTSATDAWKSVTRVNETTFKPGDSILFKRGETFHGILYPLGSGTAENPITVGAYGDSDQPPTIATYLFDTEDDRTEAINTAAPTVTAGVYLKDQSYWIIENLKVTFAGESAAAGIYVCTTVNEWQYGITVRNCSIEGNGATRLWQNASYLAGTAGIYVGHSNNSFKGYFDGVTIDGNVVRNVKGKGILVYGSVGGVNASHDGGNQKAIQNILIQNNYLQNIGQDGILTNNTVKPVIQYNVCDGAHSAYNDNNAYVAIWPFASYQSLLQYNEAYNTKTVHDGQGFDSDYMCVGTTIQYNYAHDNTGGFILICTEAKDWNGNVAFNEGTVVRYNIAQNNHHYDFTLTGGIKDTYIYNNTVFNRWGGSSDTNVIFAFNKGGLPKNLYVYNNIIYSEFAGRYQWWTSKSVAKTSIENPQTDTSLVRKPDGTLLENGNNYYQKTASCQNVVWENNLVYGRATSSTTTESYTGCPQNDTQQGVDTNLDGILAYNNKQSDPLFYEQGLAEAGLDTTDLAERLAGYKLTEGSVALGAGRVVENPSVYPCTVDFFGNSVSGSAAPNIGAYNGAAVAAKEPVYKDNYYVDYVDWETDTVGLKSTAIPYITYVYNSCTSEIVSGTAKFTGLYGSTRSVRISAPEQTDSNAGTTYSYQMNMTIRSQTYRKESNAMRFWMSGNGVGTSTVKLTYKLDGGAYNTEKTFTIPANGGWIKIDYTKGQAPSSLQFNFSKIPAGRAVFMDDIQFSLRDSLGMSDDNTSTVVTVSTSATTTVTTKATTTTTVPKEEYELGDINCDGMINSVDLLLLKRKILGLDD